MEKEKNKKKQKLIESEIKETNIKIENFNIMNSKMHSLLNELQTCFDLIRNVPSENQMHVEEIQKIKSEELDNAPTLIHTIGESIVKASMVCTFVYPFSWAVIGAMFVGSGIIFWKSKPNTERLKQIFELIKDRDKKSYQTAQVEINERINRINDELEKLDEAIKKVKSFGVDYNRMSEQQQYELGSYVNLMRASTQLIKNPILGLQSKFLSQDYESYLKSTEYTIENSDSIKELIIALANLLYKIELSEDDKKMLWEFLRENKKFLSSVNITKKEFDFDIMRKVDAALEYKYN